MTKPLLAMLIILFPPFTASGHAVLLEATPAAKTILKGPHLSIRLRFNLRIDALRSSLSLVFPDQTAHALRISGQGSPDTLNAQVDDLRVGRYRLRWQVLAADGHITRGEVPFELH